MPARGPQFFSVGPVANENQSVLRILTSFLIEYSFWNRNSGKGVTTRGQGGTITRAPNNYGGAESQRGAPKSPNNVQVLSSMQYIYFRRP